VRLAEIRKGMRLACFKINCDVIPWEVVQELNQGSLEVQEWESLAA